MTLYILVILIPRWIGYPGYTPDVILHHNPTLAYLDYAYYVAAGDIVTMQKQQE